jgi:RimJ/RimL family protein N-acetyltransferase
MGRVKLRALTGDDITKTLEWNNQEDIKDLYSGHPFPINIEMEKQWYDKILYSNIPTTVFGIELTKEKKLIGLSMLKNIDIIFRKAEFAIFIGDAEERGKGYAKSATLQTLHIGFDKYHLHRIFLHVQENNQSAIKLYEKLGFIREGILRESIYKNGKYINEIVMSILEDECS